MVVKVVTDSSSDIPPDIARELDIAVVPLYIRFGDQIYRDGIDISADEFYNRLVDTRSLPQTSIPSPGDFSEVYHTIADETDSIVSIHPSPRYSGVLNSAKAAKDYMTKNHEVEIVNSRSVSMGCGFIALAAARKAKAGANLREVLRTIEQTVLRTHIIGMINDISYLLNGRRLSLPGSHIFLGQLGSIVHCKLVGEIYEVGRVRGRGIFFNEDKALEKLQRCIIEFPSIEELAILHAHKPDWAQAIAERLNSVFPRTQIHISRLSAATGVHGGPNAIAIAFTTGTKQEK